MYYKIGNKLTEVSQEEAEKSDNIVALFTVCEWERQNPFSAAFSDMPINYNSIRFCKAESYKEYLCGTFSIPVKGNYEDRRKFIYYIINEHVVIIDNENTVLPILKNFSETKVWKTPSIEQFIFELLEAFIEDDLMYLEDLENKLSQLEDIVFEGVLEGFNQKILEVSKELMTFNRYYAQLMEIGQILEENENDIFSEDNLSLFRLFTDRAGRLQENTRSLRDYTLQIREAYQAQVDIRQNTIMKVLTVVTTIFSPLTLIVGWYGMNFVFMPEITWRYGYLMVIAISLAIISFCLWFFMKKNYFR